MYGEPMVYGVTILNNAPNRDMAEIFLDFLLDPSFGQAIMEECGQSSIIPAYSSTWDNIPDRFKRFAIHEQKLK